MNCLYKGHQNPSNVLKNLIMIFQKSENPSSHERHLLRRSNNPLFQTEQTIVDDDSLMAAQEKDHNEIVQFHEDFRKVINDTVNLKPNVESDVVLELKDRLERLYEQAFRIGDDLTEMKAALKQLLAVIMASVRAGAGNDAQAHQELDQEEAARKTHFELLKSSIVADLLNPDSVIKELHLLPTLLSSSKDELSQIVQIFDEQQLKNIVIEGEKLLKVMLEENHNTPEAIENLVFIQGYIEYLSNSTK